ncbi:BnaA04g29640D [Brassica napus]|uniref:BnaA04g29640D protein n=1 Tax=Brassica napus TaxID=3708 RepID=A0A078JJU9_BRANA|nr:BnaA04g29640D [Brassica napus]
METLDIIYSIYHWLSSPLEFLRCFFNGKHNSTCQKLRSESWNQVLQRLPDKCKEKMQQ